MESKVIIIEEEVEKLIDKADVLIKNTIRNINHELINLYWSIGKLINEYRKTNNVNYGGKVYSDFADKLSLKYGMAFSRKNINNMCLFNKIFKSWNARSNFKNVSWTHIRTLLKFKDIKVIDFYLNEIENKDMSYRELLTYIESRAFERTIANQRQGKIKHQIETTLKKPLILGIENKKRSERELEKDILNNISNFKKEIGNHVMFYENQYRININGLKHKVDLVLFDNEINSYILVDLKVKKVTNRDVFQMQMYLDYFNENMKKDSFNNTIGIILCETEDVRVLENEDIYQIKYLNEIPKDKELLKIISENKIILLKTENLKLK